MVAILFVLGLAAVACGVGAEQAATRGTAPPSNQLVQGDERPQRGGRLVYGLIAETNGWNPSTNQWGSSGLEVAHAIFDTLTAFDEDANVQPLLAERIESTPDARTWTFVLRRGVSFSNGVPVTADAVARGQSYLRKSPVLANIYGDVTAITAQGADRVVFELAKPWVQFPMLLATQIGVVADPDWLESNDSLAPVGTGPFVLDRWQIGSSLVVKRNDRYWQRDAAGEQMPYLDEIEFRVITDSTARETALASRDIDVAQINNGRQLQQLQASGRFQVYADQKEQSETFVQLNTMAPPFDDADARRALAYATDRQALIDHVLERANEQADNFEQPSSPWYAESGYPGYDQAKARELVDTVKRRHGGVFRFDLAVVPDATNLEQLQFLQQQWATVGIDATIDAQDQAKLIINVVTGNYQAVGWGQFDAPNPVLDTIWWDPDGAVAPPTFSLNFARYTSTALGDAIDGARAAPDRDTFAREMATIQRELGAGIPYVWLYRNAIGVAADRRVVNLLDHRLPGGAVGLRLNQGFHPLSQVWLKR